jgi:protein transport protein SEC31
VYALQYLEGHTKGIWSLSWSAMDTSLLLSCGKGNEVFCWNTETAKIRCQVETTNSWNSQVEWSPCVPAVLATCSMEGQVKVFSLQDPTPKVSLTSNFVSLSVARDATRCSGN